MPITPTPKSEIEKKVHAITPDQTSVIIDGQIFHVTRLDRAERHEPISLGKPKGKRGRKKKADIA